MYHSLSHVTSGGGAVYLLSVVGRIAGQDAHLCAAFSCAWPPSATFSTRRDIERLLHYQPLALRGERPHFASLRPRAHREPVYRGQSIYAAPVARMVWPGLLRHGQARVPDHAPSYARTRRTAVHHWLDRPGLSGPLSAFRSRLPPDSSCASCASQASPGGRRDTERWPCKASLHLTALRRSRRRCPTPWPYRCVGVRPPPTPPRPPTTSARWRNT